MNASDVQELEATELDSLLLQLDGKRLPKRLMLDFRSVSFMSSAMITKLVGLAKLMKSAGGTLEFCNLSPNVHEVLEIIKLNKLLGISEDNVDRIE